MRTRETSWRSAFSVYARPEVRTMAVLGFSAGLPFLLVFSTLSAWLRDEGVERTVIGFFSWVGVIFSIKVFWAPVIDRMPLPLLTRRLGKRRAWMLIAQTGIILGLLAMSTADAQTQLQRIALFAAWVAFCSATQDITIDAYRIEAAAIGFQGAMAAAYVLGYRLALLAAGAGAFYIADYSDWQTAYRIMACAMTAGVAAVLLIREPRDGCFGQAAEPRPGAKPQQAKLSRLADAVIGPFVEFFQRNGKTGLLILLLIMVYKMSDITMGVMANPFYLDLGFDKKAIADISKIFGFFMTIAGAALGGALVIRLGLARSLLLGAVLAASTNVLFALLAASRPSLWLLAGAVSADNLSGGIATSVFIAYLSGLTNTAYTATQYALFSSLMTLPAQFLGGFSGLIVDAYGYWIFFLYSACAGIPAILLTLLLMRRQGAARPVNGSG